MEKTSLFNYPIRSRFCNWKIFIMELFLTIIIMGIALGWRFHALHRANNPKTPVEYLTKLARVQGKPHRYYFEEAGKKDNIPSYIRERDWNEYMRTKELPRYMKDFLEEGKDYIDKEPYLMI